MQELRKIVIAKTGDSFRECTQIVTEPLRTLQPDEVLVRNRFAGVNGVYDQMMCLDKVSHTKVTPPADAGVEAVGVIAECGSDVRDLPAGTPVATMTVGTGYRDWQVCKAESVFRIPAATPEVLALIPSGISALVALEQVGEMQSGETVCITAAAGGLGNMLVQLAVCAGNRVIAICGGAKKAALLDAMGAHRVIDYKSEDVKTVLENEWQDALDLIMDSVGGGLFDALVDNLAPRGRLVICGYTSDRVPTEIVSQERIYTRLYWKAASVRGFMNFRYADYATDARERLLSMLAAGEIMPLLDPTGFRGLEAVSDAVEHLLAGDNLGKVFVDLREGTESGT